MIILTIFSPVCQRKVPTMTVRQTCVCACVCVFKKGEKKEIQRADSCRVVPRNTFINISLNFAHKTS